mmetsp:Transcript_33922/g.56013  ORF Transcript_33922/g.56013 Transcript_33922/m.56013 type:complete len:335 (-) Transcript_33922:256-1260(-)
MAVGAGQAGALEGAREDGRAHQDQLGGRRGHGPGRAAFLRQHRRAHLRGLRAHGDLAAGGGQLAGPQGAPAGHGGRAAGRRGGEGPARRPGDARGPGGRGVRLGGQRDGGLQGEPGGHGGGDLLPHGRPAVLPHGRPGRPHRGRLPEDHGPAEGAVQAGERQVRGAGPHRGRAAGLAVRHAGRALRGQPALQRGAGGARLAAGGRLGRRARAGGGPAGRRPGGGARPAPERAEPDLHRAAGGLRGGGREEVRGAPAVAAARGGLHGRAGHAHAQDERQAPRGLQGVHAPHRGAVRRGQRRGRACLRGCCLTAGSCFNDVGGGRMRKRTYLVDGH